MKNAPTTEKRPVNRCLFGRPDKAKLTADLKKESIRFCPESLLK